MTYDPTSDLRAGLPPRVWGELVGAQRAVPSGAAYLDQFTVGPGSSNGSDGTITIQDDTKLVALHGQLCSRLARLLRKERQLYHIWREDEIQKATYEALDILSEMGGVDL